MVSVDDVLAILHPQNGSSRCSRHLKGVGECKIMGVIVKDNNETYLAVQSLVFRSITIEPTKEGFQVHQQEFISRPSSKRKELEVEGRLSLQ